MSTYVIRVHPYIHEASQPTVVTDVKDDVYRPFVSVITQVFVLNAPLLQIAHPIHHARVCHVHRGIRGGIIRHYHRYRAHCQPKTRTSRRLSMPPLETCKIHSATRSHQAPTTDVSGTTAHAQTRTHTDSYALLLWIADSTCRWSYGALSLDAQVGVRVDPPTLKAI